MPAPVVFVHDLRGSGDDWPAAAGEAIRVELPGHGARASSPFSVEASLDGIRVALLGLARPAVLVGNGVGAHLAIAAAAEGSAALAGLVAVGCGTETLGWLADSYRIASTASVLHGDRGSTVAAWASATFAGGDDRAPVAADAGFDAELGRLAALDTRAALRLIAAPVRLVNGSRDRFRLQEGAFVRACRDGALSRVPGSTERMRNPALAARLTTVLAELEA
ncbi:hypothetical protein QT381_02160 [Galbitalea sp. SE-J8]|uniref:alpha/beta fold hydrolase n=1 Tax=Galbitalea sp. SE-J8 TaxID=3054952 RepID=UPI00259CBC1D|nr:alpha/beta fold hydrolase [Galbitalea sp. SE-J8]MDM4761808.1 hypothetical protein [Galbitalea sp. SE-J8]